MPDRECEEGWPRRLHLVDFELVALLVLGSAAIVAFYWFTKDYITDDDDNPLWDVLDD